MAQGQDYNLLKDCIALNSRTLTPEQKTRIAKSRDLFAFGESLYDLMLNKSARDEQIQQKIVRQGDITPQGSGALKDKKNGKKDGKG